MHKRIMFLSALGLVAAFSVQAAEQNNPEAIIAACEKQAREQGVEDVNAFIGTCMDEKLGYEKEK